MHYRTSRVNSLETADAFVELFGSDVHTASEPAFSTGDLPASDRPVVVVPATP
jgi:hypothetical protein